MNWTWLINIAFVLPGILIGLTVHEYCHAWAAFKLGDTTSKDQGRLTLNPLKHIDPIGFVFLIFAGFGWAKPVRFSPENLRNPRRDKALIAAAGPVSNFLLALVFILLIKGCYALVDYANHTGNGAILSFLGSKYFFDIYRLLIQSTLINFGLFVFNLLPIPPLDGSHIFFSGLNLKPETETKIMRIGGPLLLLIILIQYRTEITILPISKLAWAMMSLFIR